MRAVFKLLLCCSLLLSSVVVSSVVDAFERVIVASEQQPLSQVVYYQADIGQNVSELIAMPVSAWQAQYGEALNLGYTTKAYWVRQDVELINRDDYLLDISYPVLDSLRVVVFKDNKRIDDTLLGDRYPFSERRVPHQHFLLPLNKAGPDVYTFLIRVESTSSVQLPMTIWQAYAFGEVDHELTLMQGFYFGWMGIMAAYNLLLFVSIRDKSLLYYFVYVSFVCMFYASLSGLSFRHLWPEATWWNDQSILVFLVLTVMTGTAFIVNLLDLKRNHTWLFRGCVGLLSFGVMMMIAVWFLPYQSLVQVIIVYAVIACVWGVVTRSVRIFEGTNFSMYYSLAWNSALCGGVILAASKFNFIPTNWFSENALLLGTGLEAVFLSFAVAERIHEEKRKRISAQGQTVQEVRNANARLEHQVSIRTRELKEAYERLKFVAKVDELTQTFNRRSLNESLEQECNRARRHNHVLALLMIDIDHFKKINDKFGHQCGDDALVHIANIIKSKCNRPGEMVARYGGEEFCVLLPECDKQAALDVAERVRQFVATHPFQYYGESLSITISIGVTYAKGDDLEPESLIKTADDALYRAKENGRNQVNLGLRHLQGVIPGGAS